MPKQFKVTLSREVAQSAEIVVTADSQKDAQFAAGMSIAQGVELNWSPDPAVSRPKIVNVETAE